MPKLSPGRAEQWGHCSGANVGQSGAPSSHSDARSRGGATHWLCAQALCEGVRAQSKDVSCGAWLGQVSPEGVVIDETMVRGAQIYVTDVLSTAAENDALSGLLIEHDVSMPDVHEDNSGTLDCALRTKGGTELFIWEYKNGYSPVSAKHNLQLINYVFGLFEQIQVRMGGVTVIFRVVQPFCYQNDGPINEWRCDISELHPFLTQLHDKAHEAPTLNSGAWCSGCPSLRSCSAARKHTYAVFEYVNDAYVMDSMTGRDLAIERDLISNGIKVAKARYNAIEDELKHRLDEGDKGTGLELRAGRGPLTWSVSNEVAKAMTSQFGLDIGVGKILTPTQALDTVARGLREQLAEAISIITYRPVPDAKLVAVGASKGALAFEKKGE